MSNYLNGCDVLGAYRVEDPPDIYEDEGHAEVLGLLQGLLLTDEVSGRPVVGGGSYDDEIIGNMAAAVGDMGELGDVSASTRRTLRHEIKHQNVLLGGGSYDDEIVGYETGDTEIQGEMLDDNGEIVGNANVIPSRAGFAERAASDRPLLHETPLVKARDWQIDFPTTFGLAGSITTLQVFPQVLFRGEQVMASDTGFPPTFQTRIMAIFVGQKSQKPANVGGTITNFFVNTAIGNGIRWDTCPRALSISITVSFIQSCSFDLTVFGKAVTT